MTGSGKPCTNARIRPRKTGLIVLHQLIGKRRVLLAIAIAGDDQVVGQRPHQAMQVLDQWRPAPLNQSLVEPAHALSLTSGQQQYRTGSKGIERGHDELGQREKKGCCDITPHCFLYNRT